MESSFGQRVPEVVVMTPDGFAQAGEAVLAVQQQRTVVLHLGGMPADEAQRTIDFVSGGVFAMDGQSERLGEMVFLFAPAVVRIQRDSKSWRHSAALRCTLRKPASCKAAGRSSRK